MAKKISELDDITTVAAGDLLPVVDVSETPDVTKYCTPAEMKTYVLGGAVVGGNASADILTKTGAQTGITNKSFTGITIAGATITGTSTIGNGCTLTTPVLTKPDINGGTIDGAVIDDTTTVELSSGAVACSTLVDKTTAQTLTNKTLTTPIIASLYQDAGKTITVTIPAKTDTLVGKTTTDTLTNKTLTTPRIDSLYGPGAGLITVPTSSGADTVILADATQTLTAKTLNSPVINAPTITGGSIDATCKLNGKPVSTAFAEITGLIVAAIEDVSNMVTLSCVLKEESSNPGKTISITDDQIWTAVGITGMNSSTYKILGVTVNMNVYSISGSTLTALVMGTSAVVTDGIIAVITNAGSGQNDALEKIDFSQLPAAATVYAITLSFRAMAL